MSEANQNVSFDDKILNLLVSQTQLPPPPTSHPKKLKFNPQIILS